MLSRISSVRNYFRQKKREEVPFATASYWLFMREHWAWWLTLVFGTLLTRVIFEFALLAFRSYERLVEIRDALAADSPRYKT